MVTLEKVLEYKNENVIEKFRSQYDLNREESEDVFKQMLSWLWLAGRLEPESRQDSIKKLVIDSSLLIIDEMWHTFILFTRDYSYFCNKYFGRYLHHQPTSKKEQEEHIDIVKSMSEEERIAFFKDRKREQYVYVYDTLGEATFKKWYVEYHRKFTKNKLKELAT